jgi:hypothetical protein
MFNKPGLNSSNSKYSEDDKALIRELFGIKPEAENPSHSTNDNAVSYFN